MTIEKRYSGSRRNTSSYPTCRCGNEIKNAPIYLKDLTNIEGNSAWRCSICTKEDPQIIKAKETKSRREKCIAIKTDGKRCNKWAMEGSRYCNAPGHNPMLIMPV